MNYWVIIDRHKFGPLTLDETRRMPLTADTYVWHRGLPTWVRAGEVAELADLFNRPEQPVVEETTVTTVDSDGDIVEKETEVTVEMPVSRPAPPPPPPMAPAMHPRPESRPPQPPSYLGWCIASIILCCLIPGIIATIYASKVSPLYNSGDYDGARRASERAELWLIITITVGIVWAPFSMVISML